MPATPKRGRGRIPPKVREAVRLMVYGRLDDPDCAPVGFIEAAKIVEIKPDVMRRSLDRADVRALLMGERRAFRAAVCAGNELSLRRVRDCSANGMATVAAVRALEQLDEADAPHRSGNQRTPGVTIIIHPAPPAGGPIVDITPGGPPQTIPHDPQSEGCAD